MARTAFGTVAGILAVAVGCSRPDATPAAGVAVAAPSAAEEVAMPGVASAARAADPRPPLDRAIPARLETATFAVG